MIVLLRMIVVADPSSKTEMPGSINVLWLLLIVVLRTVREPLREKIAPPASAPLPASNPPTPLSTLLAVKVQLMILTVPPSLKMAPPKAKADVHNADGSIPADEITSHVFGDGLLPGKHKVQIIPFDDHDQPLPGLVPQEYRDAKTTPVEIDTASGELIIKVKKPAAGSK